METLVDTTTPDQTVCAGINEGKFFASMKHIFANSFSVLGELMQNARRAGASAIHFTVDRENESLTVQDDGCGITDFGALITLCQSGWDDKVKLEEQPFGMGLFSLFFAGDRVIFRSMGKSMQLTLDDIVNKRLIAVRPDHDKPVNTGTIIEIRNLKEAFRGGRHTHGIAIPEGADANQLTPVASEIRVRAKGFGIPVFINGEPCEQPHAQRALAGEMTSIGFVSMPGVHDNSLSPSRVATKTVAMYLQGLPIGPLNHHGKIVVHLDSKQFVARMPDRSHLYDAEVQSKRIDAEIVAVGARYLAKRKHEISGLDFVQLHWDDCQAFGVSSLLNDIPWIPKRLFCALEHVSLDRHQTWSPSSRSRDECFSQDDLVFGRINAWRYAPDTTEDSTRAAMIMKFMQHKDIYAVDTINSEHWIHRCSPDAQSMRFRYEAFNSRGDECYWDGGRWDECAIQLVDRVILTVTSPVDPAFEMTAEFDSDWLVVPRDDNDLDDHGKTFCFVPNLRKWRGHPADVFSDYRDENEYFREDWQARERGALDSRIASLLGTAMAPAIERVLFDTPFELPRFRAGQMALVLADGSANEHDGRSSSVSVVDLELDTFWDQVASALASSSQDVVMPMADRLKVAFLAACATPAVAC